MSPLRVRYSVAILGCAVFGTPLILAQGRAQGAGQGQAGMPPPEFRLQRLDGLVALTPAQQPAALEILTAESRDFAAIKPDERLLRGVDVKLEAAEKIRGILSDDQRRKYNLASQAEGGGRNVMAPEDEVARLDGLVTLGADQRVAAHKVFEDQVLQLMDVKLKDRPRDWPEIRQEARRQVTKLLSADQLRIYLTTTMSRGGGMEANPGRLADWTDQNVTLTDDQVRPVVEIYARMAVELQAVPPGEQPSKRAALRTTAAAQIRSLLTPDQQVKFDANPNQALDIEEQADVASIVKAVPALSARVGELRKLVLRNGDIRFTDQNGMTQAKFGKYIYDVVGDRTESMTVTWERMSSNDPVKVTRIETSDGQQMALR